MFEPQLQFGYSKAQASPKLQIRHNTESGIELTNLEYYPERSSLITLFKSGKTAIEHSI
jgi:hypothetical protein